MQISTNSSEKDTVARILKNLLPFANYTVEIISKGVETTEWSESTSITGATLQEGKIGFSVKLHVQLHALPSE